MIVPVIAERDAGAARDLLARLARLARESPGAEILAEVRLDALDQPDPALLRDTPVPVIATCRRTRDGGCWAGSEEARRELLVRASAHARWVDVEGDVACDLATDSGARRLVSWHDLDACPDDLDGLVARGAAAGAAAVKLAVRVRGFPELLRLRDAARAADPPVVAVGLGPAGIPGRLLPRRLCSAWTYARLAGPTTVAGELAPSLPDLESVRALPGDLAGRGDPVAVFGVLGDRALESIGPSVFNRLFAGRKLPALYLPLQVDDLDGLREFAAAFGVRGLSVTTPFKERVLGLVDRVEPLARDVGAANTLVLKDGLWEARNTDVAGVYGPLLRALAGSGTRGPALVLGAGGAGRAAAWALRELGFTVTLGAGGAGRAAAWALRELGFTVTLAARTGARAERAAELLDVRAGTADPQVPWRVIVNATPAGGSRDPDSLPCPPEIVCGDQIVFEMNYLPAETPLLRLAAERGARLIPGRTMYAEQAWRQLQTWWGGAPGLEQDLRELVTWATLGLESS